MVFIVSWNVASWPTTSATVRKCYRDQPLATFLSRFGADIIALQESKVSRKKLQDSPFESGACDRKGNTLEGWESFWACSEGCGGMNGVVTFARAGLVRSATARPLDDPELDDEGRCVVTVFSHFVLFNVYVVNGRCGARYDFKLRFLKALGNAMDRQRAATGLPVVLAGDLNTTYRAVDCHWAHRQLNMARIKEQGPSNFFDAAMRDLVLAAVAANVAAAAAKEEGSLVAPTKASAPRRTGSAATTARDNRLLGVQQPVDKENIGIDVAPRTVNGSGARSGGDPESSDEADGSHQIEDAETKPTAPPVWVDSFIRPLIRIPVAANRVWFCAASPDVGGEPSHWSGKDAEWLASLVVGDSSPMVDTFAVCNPDATCCFTAFDQYRNKRFSNEGNRIDYILVDRVLARDIVIPFSSPSCDQRTPADGGTLLPTALTDAIEEKRATPPPPRHPHLNEWTALEGVSATTANGLFQSAPMDGGGLPDISPVAADTLFRGLPVNGLIYTPPQFSDHVAVACVLPGVVLTAAGSPTPRDAQTLACQYRPRMQALDRFFASAPRRPAFPFANGITSSDGGGGVSPSSPAASASSTVAESLSAPSLHASWQREPMPTAATVVSATATTSGMSTPVCSPAMPARGKSSPACGGSRKRSRAPSAEVVEISD